MKRYLFILFAAASVLYACKDNTVDTTSGPLSNLTAEPNIGAVVLKWDNPSLGNYYYSVVEYVNAAGDTVKLKVSRYAEDSDLGSGHTRYVIGGFEDTNTYEFKVTPYTTNGFAGETMTVSCAPEDKQMAYKYIASTASARATVEGAVLKWVNEYGVPVNVTVTYKNLTGETITETVKDSDLTDSLDLYAFVDPTTITVTSSNQSGAKSNVTNIEVTPLRGEIPHNRMSVLAASSIWAAAHDTKNLLDNNVNTYWHTAVNVNYPHWFIVDMRTMHRINWLEIVRRTDKEDEGTPLKVGFEYSTDGQNFTEIGIYDFVQEHIYNHAFNFDPIDCRWIRVTLYNDSFKGYSYLSEFLAYYADNADRYATESAAELMPDPDDDPNYYPEIEYIIPDSRKIVNQLTYEQSNPGNPSQYTYVTSGGDPFIAMRALEKEAAGTVLVFQYQSTHALNCEFFWCPGGYAVGGPTPGKETFFNIQATSGDKWKTFKKNFASDWTTHGWTGKPGDAVRFDVGTVNGATVVIRNMHWRAAVEGE